MKTFKVLTNETRKGLPRNKRINPESGRLASKIHGAIHRKYCINLTII